MIFKLEDNISEYLLTQPESGIGYQIIDALDVERGDRLEYIVLNAEIAVENNKDADFYVNTLVGYCYEMLINSVNVIQLADVTVQNNDLEIIQVKNTIKSFFTDHLSMSSSDLYVRPTVFVNDRRIDENNNKILPGSCLTTLDCLQSCTSKKRDPFHVFTIPDYHNFVHVYIIKQSFDNIKNLGIFQQIYGKRGGGIKITINGHGVIKKRFDKVVNFEPLTQFAKSE